MPVQDNAYIPSRLQVLYNTGETQSVCPPLGESASRGQRDPIGLDPQILPQQDHS